MSDAGLDASVLEKIPQSLLNVLPAGMPPPGIKANFENPETLLPTVLGTLITFLILAVSTYAIRIYTRIMITRNWKWEDTTITLGLIITMLYISAVVTGCTHGSVCIHIWELHLDRILSSVNYYSLYMFVTMINPALYFVKITFVIQFYNLFRPLRWLRLSCYIGGGIITFVYMGTTITSFVLNSPWHGESWLSTVLSWHFLAFTRLSTPLGALGMAIDVFILILPIPAVLGLNTSLQKKLAILVVFMFGVLAVVSSTLSLFYRYELDTDAARGTPDPSWRAGYIALWTQIELLSGIFAANMPSVHQFFKRSKTFGSINFSITKSVRHLFSSFTSTSNSHSSKTYDSLHNEKKRSESDNSDAGSDHTTSHTAVEMKNNSNRPRMPPNTLTSFHTKDSRSQIVMTQDWEVTRDSRF